MDVIDHKTTSDEEVDDGHEIDLESLREVTASIPAASATKKRYTNNDSGNADSFLDSFGGGLRFLAKRGEWLLWDQNRWRVDGDSGVVRLAKQHAQARLQQAAALPDDVRSDAVRHALKLGNSFTIHSMLKMAEVDTRVVVSDDRLDRDALLLGVENGVVDLRTGQLRPGSKADLITKSAGIVFDSTARCPRWNNFITEVLGGDTALIEYVQKAVGYSLSGSVKEQCFFFLYGGGCNGKSTFMEVLQALVGDYGKRAPQSLFTALPNGREPQTDMARLTGARVIIGSEVEEGSKLAESRVKDLTGGDRITARFLYSQAFEFDPQFKIWMFGNHKPSIRGQDFGLWRRVRLILFTVQIAQERGDPNLLAHLKSELPGILNWAIEGCLKWQAEPRLVPPQIVEDAVKEYKEDEDLLADFLRNHRFRLQCFYSPAGPVSRVSRMVRG